MRLRLPEAKNENRFPSLTGQLLTLPIDWEKKRKKWKTMNFFILNHTRYRVERGFLTLYIVVLISFYKNRTRISQLLSNRLKNTRKTIFEDFSKLKLLEVIRHFRITYSRRSTNWKIPEKRNLPSVLFCVTNMPYLIIFKSIKELEYHDNQALREEKNKRKDEVFWQSRYKRSWNSKPFVESVLFARERYSPIR